MGLHFHLPTVLGLDSRNYENGNAFHQVRHGGLATARAIANAWQQSLAVAASTLILNTV